MCGIWALLSQAWLSEARLTELFKAFMKIKNRGPEYTSFDIIGNDTKLLLGFHRLAIMDPSAKGNQPFHFVRDDGSCVYCVCNGEIYDYEELKERYGIVTESESDCEVIIPLYEKLGVDKMIRLLGSEFAFVILDIGKNGSVKMIVGNDPIGVRPVFYSENENSLCVSSELKGVSDVYDRCYRFPPGHYMIYENGVKTMVQYYFYVYKELSAVPNIEMIYSEIRNRLINAVRRRMMSDRPFGALLSGGLDSSLIFGLIIHLIQTEFTELQDKEIECFTIGLSSGSTDIPYAIEVVEFLKKKHPKIKHHIIYTDEHEALNAMDETIYACESWCITTIRASIMNRLVCKYVQEKTNVRVIFTGENSDECNCSYLFFHNAPNVTEAKNEGIRLVKDVHKFDGLRADRCAAYHGIEVRIGFADPEYVDYIFNLPAHLLAPINGIEKYTLRNAFRNMNIIPERTIDRVKAAFSDAVSLKERSWYQIIQEHINTKITDEEYCKNKDNFKYCSPFTKESYYYRKKFVEYFGDSEETAKVIPYFWMPKWSPGVLDPSARVLTNYRE